MKNLACRGHRKFQKRFSHGGNPRGRYSHTDVPDAGHDGEAQIGPHWLQQGRKAIGIEQFVSATHEERGRLPAASEGGQIVSRCAEIDCESERIDTGEARNVRSAITFRDSNPNCMVFKITQNQGLNMES